METTNYYSSSRFKLPFLVNRPELSSIEKITKLYTLFLESVRQTTSVTRELQRHLANGLIPLEVLKEQSAEIEKIIGMLGSITLTIDPQVDEIAILVELKKKLRLDKPDEIRYLGKRIHQLVTDISSSHKDKNLNNYLNYLKEKAWLLLEAMEEYALTEYDYVLCP